MTGPENTQPEETIERSEAAERTTEQINEEIAIEPGARIEETQSFEQAEAVETALVEAVEMAENPGERGLAEMAEVPEGLEFELADEKDDDDKDEATPINLPGPVAAVTNDPDHGPNPFTQSAQVAKDHQGTGGITPDELAVNMEPIPSPEERAGVLPVPIPEPAMDETGRGRHDPELDPQPLVNVADGRAKPVDPDVPPPPPDAEGRTFVAEEPGHGPNPITQEENAQRGAVSQPSGDVSATPINLPNPVEESVQRGAVSQPSGDISATPINLPNPVENDLEISNANLERMPEGVGDAANGDSSAAEVGMQPELEMSAARFGDGLPAVEGETLVDQGLEFSLGSEDSGEPGQDAPSEQDEGTNDAQKWYLHENNDGSTTVVDENGRPVESPPNIIYYNGKYYAVYPGDKFPVKADGTVTDSSQLAKFEISSYQPSTESVYLHENKDGSVTVVDENGKAVDSPPNVIYYNGKYYAVKPGSDPIASDGSLKDPNGLIELPNYQASTAGIYLHDDGDGNITVVDEHGKPVDSPPNMVYYQGKYYAVKPGSDPIASDGSLKDPSGLIELSNYQASTAGIYLHDDGKGNVTVVDENGKEIDSPPNMVYYQGKYYAVKPGSDPIAPDGSLKDPNGLIELSGYKTSTEGMYLYDDGNGNITVVDENGKPVDSPPAVIKDPTTGKYYLSYETDPTKMPKDGTLGSAAATGSVAETSFYKTSTDGMYLHDDGDGNITVVDENGMPVDSPPTVILFQGKYYAAYPGESPIGPDGKVKDPSKLAELEIANYKPSWWGKKNS